MEYEEVEVNSERWFDLTPLLNEEFRDIKGYEELYQVSNYGRVKSLYGYNGLKHYFRVKILKTLNNGKDYLSVSLTKNKKISYLKIHRLVANEFIPNPNNYSCINHKDCNRTNNMVYNLEWCSLQYNNEYSHNIPVLQKDINNKLIKEWESITKAAIALGIQKSNISYVCKGKREKTGGFKWEYVKGDD